MNTYSNEYENRVNREEVVLFCDEKGILTGETGPKLDSHTADTKMHSAFSVYVFNDQGQLLITQRAHTKKIWHGVWTNTCCGHLTPGENAVDAIKRRLDFELGMSAEDYTLMISDYTYKTPPYDGIIEHEFCPVYVARMVTPPQPNPNEVEDFAWMSWEEFVEQTSSDSADYSDVHAKNAPKWSWWCKDQLKLLVRSKKLTSFRDS